MIKKIKKQAIKVGVVCFSLSFALFPSVSKAKEAAPEKKIELEEVDKLLEDAEDLVNVLAEIEEAENERIKKEQEKLDKQKINGVVYYSQIEEPWRNIPYGRGSSGTVYWTGCGPVSMAMVASTLNNREITPKEVAEYSIKNGHIIPGNGGTYHSLFTKGAEKYNLNVEKISGKKAADQALSEGKIIINNVSSALGGYWTYLGHYVVIAGKTDDGMYLANDPASRERTEKKHTANQVFIPSKAMYAFSLKETE